MKVRVGLAVAFPLFALAVACGNGTERGSGVAISRGETAPGFVLPSATGERVALSDFAGRKPVLL